MDYQILKVSMEENDSIAVITNSRPKAMNALNRLFFDELENLLDELSSKEKLRVIILTGEGKAFAAGADIAQMADMTKEEGLAFSRRGQSVFKKIQSLEKIVIAAVNGFALGGGCELAMACDFRLASDSAKFSQPEVSLGLIPGFAGTGRLPRLVGLGDAMYMTLTGDMIDAESALRMGLVQKVFSTDSLMEEAKKIALSIATKGPQAVVLAKKTLRQGVEEDFESACKIEAENFSSLFEGEAREGMKAFLEKRKAEW